MLPERAPRRRLTRPGAAAAIGGAVGVVAGRVLGIEEISALGAILAGLVVISIIVVRAAGSDMSVHRTVRPRRVEVGDRFTVSLQIHNGRSYLRLPLVLRDTLDHRPVERLTLLQQRRDPACTADYDVTASRRGLTTFGPITLESTDPLGFARMTMVIDERIDVIVLPRIHPLGLQGALAADDPSGGLRHRRQIATMSEEFDTLRDYVPGDDVRRVHWSSTARLGRPMVRTHQQPSQRRTTVVLDDRAMSYPPSRGTGPFERAVSAAASAVVACRDQGDLVRLVSASGSDTQYFDDRQRLDSVLDQLAAVSTAAVGSLRGALAAAAVVGSGDRVIVCTGTIDAHDRAAVAGSASRGGEHIVISTSAPGATDARASAVPVSSAAATRNVLGVIFAEGDHLDHQWQTAVRERSTGRPSVAS